MWRMFACFLLLPASTHAIRLNGNYDDIQGQGFITAVDSFWSRHAAHEWWKQSEKGILDASSPIQSLSFGWAMPAGFADSVRYHPRLLENTTYGPHRPLIENDEDHNEKVRRVAKFEEDLQRILAEYGGPMTTLVQPSSASEGPLFNLDRLAADVTAILNQYGFGAKHGALGVPSGINWSTVQLLSADGTQNDRIAKKNGGHYMPTDVFESVQGSELYSILKPLFPALGRVRLSSVFPGDLISYHRDYRGNDAPVAGHAEDVCRCHIQVSGQEHATTKVGLQKSPAGAGQFYCGDYIFPHTVWNLLEGSPRTNLMIDFSLPEMAKLEGASRLAKALARSCAGLHDYNTTGRTAAVHASGRAQNVYRKAIGEKLPGPRGPEGAAAEWSYQVEGARP